jgi:SMODS-associated and fused to various effectors sensor domain
MAKAITARMQGDDYQARFFWLQACRLFQPYTKVCHVAYELDRVKSFDDVVVTYSEPLCLERGDLVEADYFQVKFHVNQAGAFTCAAFIDPKFINATRVSLLQRLHAAQRAFAPNGTGCRLIIVSPWIVHPDDPLAVLVSNNGGEFHLDKLFDGTGDRSEMGRVRKLWRDHLGIGDDDLKTVLRPLRIYKNAPTLLAINEDLNRQLDALGFVPVALGQKVHPYDDLIKKLLAEGSNEFTRDILLTVTERESLRRCELTSAKNEVVPIGIRSFMRWAEHMEDETADMLCLVRFFDGRGVCNGRFWSDNIFPEVESFISKHSVSGKPSLLMLDTHSSVAFAAGYCLESKSGADIAPVQRTRAGKEIWHPQRLTTNDNCAGWSVTDTERRSEGNDVAVAISVTHDVTIDVKDYVERALPSAHRILACSIEPKPGLGSLRDANHALFLVEELASLLKRRPRDERAAALHIFASAPNAFMFFLGQMAKGFGPCTMYEYDFDSNALGAYQASISFPPRSEAIASPER